VSDRAADMLGIGWGNVRHIAVDGYFRMRVDELREQIVRDRRDGIRPFAVVGSAGTVSTGAIDPLEQIADVCAEEGLWFHVDGAYGGPAMLADDLRPQFAGIERADSIAFDPHVLYTPHSGACLLLRDPRSSRSRSTPTLLSTRTRTSRTQASIWGGTGRSSAGATALESVSLLAHGRRAYGAASRTMPSWPGTWPRVSRAPGVRARVSGHAVDLLLSFVPPDLPEGPGREAYLSLLNERLMGGCRWTVVCSCRTRCSASGSCSACAS
jgi:hypothetical protein